MQDTDAFERDWRDRGLPLHREMTFTQAGLALGRGTILAEFERNGRAARGLALDGEDARLLSLLAAAYREPLAGGVLEKIRRAGEIWRAGDKALAQIHLAFMGLPKIDEADAYRLFLAGTALEKGVSPSDLMKAMGFPRAARDIEKYNPDQPRAPAGSGRESGQWTSGEASGSGTAAQSRVPRNAHVKPFVPHVVGGVVSDANPDGIVTGAQYAQASPTPVLTAERIKHILEMHGPGAKDRNAEFIKWLVEGAWEKAIPTHVYAG
jgi:hypothetical protein